MLFFPKMYQASILDIDYKSLYQQGIRGLFFDLDNTVGLLEHRTARKEIQTLFLELHKKFKIAIISNNWNRARVLKFAKSLDCDFYYLAMKPSVRCLKLAASKFHLSKKQICMIGDQLMTDILAANRYGIYSCLVDAMSSKDLKITSVNRFFENIVWKRYQRQGIMKKGEYYE